MQTRQCPQCGEPFDPVDQRQVFCSPAHRRSYYDLCAIRGKTLLSLALVWREGKRGKTAARSYAFAELCALLDKYRAEDKAHGRRPDLLIDQRMRTKRSVADL